MKKTITLILIFVLLLGAYTALNAYRAYSEKKIELQNANSVKSPSAKISAVVFNDSKKIIEVTYDNGATITIPRDMPEGVQDVKTVDINFDGVDDIQVTEYAGAYNAFTYFLVYNPTKKVYEEYQAFRQALNLNEDDTYLGLGYAQFDPSQRTIKSYFKGRGLGDLYEEELFTFVNGAWQLTQTETQDLLNYPSKEGEIQYYINTKISYADGATTTQSVTYLKASNGDISSLVEVSEKEIKKAGLIK